MRESAKVQPLHETPVTKVVATGFNLVINLAGERQITFQSGYEGDEADEAVHARIDRMMAIGDRYKARYSIPEIESDLATQEQTFANLQVDKARLDIEYEAAQAARDDELRKCRDLAGEHILDLQARKREIENNGVAAWNASGRRGDYAPKGASLTNIERFDKGIEDAQTARDKAAAGILADIEKAQAEKTRADENMAISMDRWTKAIEDTKAKLAHMKALAGA